MNSSKKMTQFDILQWKHNFQKLKYKQSCLKSDSCFNSKLHTMSKFEVAQSDDFKLPIVVSGRLLTSDSYFEPLHGYVNFEPDVLKQSLSKWEGIKIYKSHSSWLKSAKGEHVPIDDVVGKIIKTVWNEKENAIEYVAEIMDRGIAYKIATELIDSVSVGFSKSIEWLNDMAFARDITPRELSLVFNPKDKRASVKVKEIRR